MSIKQKFETVYMPAVMRAVNTVVVRSIKDGMVATMALTIIGSIFLLLARFPYMPIQQWFADIGATPALLQVSNATFSILALVSVIAIAYYYARHSGVEALSCGILSGVSYILLIDMSIKVEGVKDAVTGVIPMSALGSRGMVAAIIIGLSVGMIYVWFLKRGITIKMPPGVPQGVADSFASIIPGAVVISISMVLFGVFKAMGTNLIDVIYKIVQTPLQGLTSSFGGALVMAFAMSFLWWFGVHGASIIAGIMGGILTSNMLDNQAILDAGQILSVANGGQIVTYNFRSLLIIMTGSGITIGIVIFMAFFAKSQQFKTLGRLSLGSAIFNINEPILFGAPIVLNPILFIPFVGVPMLATTVAYFSMKFGLVPLMANINPPWTTPGIISGLLSGGVRMALLQVVIILISIVGYYPFIKKQDEIYYAAELAAEEELRQAAEVQK